MRSLRTSRVLLTLGKELRETLRDRRTVAVMVLFPLVVYPLLSLLATQAIATRERKQDERPSQVAIVGGEPLLDEVRVRLRGEPKLFQIVDAGKPTDIDTGSLDALVQVRPASAAPTAGTPPLHLEIAYDTTRDESRKAEERVAEVLDHLAPPGCLTRFDVARRDLASGTKLGGYVMSKALPLMLVLMVLLGAFYPAIDVTAGERERGTLETILSSPIDRRDLLLGKVLAVTLLAATTGLLNLASMSLTLVQVMRIAAPAAALPIPWTRAAATILVILPSAFFAAALFVAVGSLARGFKEAQNLLMPVYFTVLLPTTVGTLGEFPLTGIACVVPGMNVTLLARELALGRGHLGVVLAVVGSTLVYGLLAVALAARLYDSERFLNIGDPRQAWSAKPGDRPAAEGPKSDAATSAGEAMFLFAIAYLLLYFVLLPLQQKNLVRGLLISQWGGLLALVALYARARGRRLADVLALRWPSARAVLGATMMGGSAWIAVGLLSQWLVPVPPEVIEKLQRALVPTDGSRSLWVILFVTALTPAVCEEALFRGPILRGLSSRLPAGAAIVVTGLLFGLFHMDLWRLLPTALLGMMLSWIAWQSESIVPAMLAHGLNNGLLLVLASRHLDQSLDNLGKPAQGAVFIGSLVLVAAGAALARSARPRARM